jgi:hypothetical protein
MKPTPQPPKETPAMNSLLAALPWPRAMTIAAPSLLSANVDIELPDATPDELFFCRCGWFDSSLELASGLLVIEHGETLPDDLPIVALH